MTNLKITYEYLNCRGLINTIGIGTQVYYDPTQQTFVAVDSSISLRRNGISQRDFAKYVELPYDVEYNQRTWGKFYEMLTESETTLARSYPYRKGYFNYLRETGLIEHYETAKDLVAADVISDWEVRNNVSPNWEDARIY